MLHIKFYMYIMYICIHIYIHIYIYICILLFFFTSHYIIAFVCVGANFTNHIFSWLHNILTGSMDMNLSELQEIVQDRGAWRATVCGAAKSQTRLSN